MDNGVHDLGEGQYRDYRRKVSAFVQAVTTEDDATTSRLFPEICDSPHFDTTLAEVTADRDDGFDPVDFRYDVLSMSSITCATYHSTSGRAHALIQLFFIPLSGPLSSIHSISHDREALTEIGKSFIEADLATSHSSIVVCGSLIDPVAAAQVTPGKIRLALRMISPVLTGKIGEDTLGEALSTVFALGSRPPGDMIANRLLPVARIITPPDGKQGEDPLSSYRIDAVSEEQFPIKRWHRRMSEIIPESVVVGDPCSIMRGCATMTARIIEHALLSKAAKLGYSDIPKLDQITLTRTDDEVHLVGTRQRETYGPVSIPLALFFSDMTMISDFVDGLSDTVIWSDEPPHERSVPRAH